MDNEEDIHKAAKKLGKTIAGRRFKPYVRRLKRELCQVFTNTDGREVFRMEGDFGGMIRTQDSFV
jgi:hypothetical protein